MIGIYKITNPDNKIYIGQSINIENRWKDHRNINAKRKTKLHKSFINYGVENHKFEIIQECEKDELNHLEAFFIHKYDSVVSGFNTHIPATYSSYPSVQSIQNEMDAILRVANVEPDIIVDDIKAKYQQLKHKTVFIRLLAANLKKSPAYLRNQWFGTWSIPISEQPKVLEFLNNVLKNQ